MSARVAVSENRRTIVVFAVVFSFLLAFTPTASVGAAASDELVVGSQHDSFGTTGAEPSPQTLANLTIAGSGDSATATLDDIEGQDHKWAFDDSSDTSTAIDSWGSAAATISGATYTTGIDGSALRFNGSSDYAEASVGDNPDMTIAAWVNPESFPNSKNYIVSREGVDSGIILRANSSGVIHGYVYDSASNAFVSVVSSSAIPTGDWTHVAFRIDDGTSISLYIDGSQVDSASIGSRVLDTSNGALQIGAKQVSSGDSYESFWDGRIDDVRTYSTVLSESTIEYLANNPGADADSAPATYVSAVHEVSNAEEAAINITQASNVSIDATVRTDGGTTLATDTITSTGNHTLALSDTSSSSLEVVLDISVTGKNPEFDLSDESILFTNHKPNASNIQPVNGTELADQTVEFTANISDPEFSTAQGDTVTATLYIDGASVGSRTISSNTTVSITHEINNGGSHTYHWVLQDSYGATTTTNTLTITAPGNLYLRQETQPSQLVDNAQVNITYYAGDQIIRANTSDGSIDLSGLPVDKTIVALAEAPGYHTRTIVITSIYEQNSLYLLNESVTSHEIIFDINDPTGQYPSSDTILKIQRDIKLNGTVEWRTVAGDLFGAQGVVTDLQTQERYRLVIMNLETGDRTVLGAFTPTTSGQVTLQPGAVTVTVNASSDTALGYEATRTSDGASILVEYSDPDQTTATLTIQIHQRYNDSNILLANTSFSNLGNLTYEVPLSPSEQNTSWTVEYYWTLEDGNTSHAIQMVGQGPRDIVPDSLDAVIRVSVGVCVLLITSLLFSELNVGVGAITTALAGGLLWYLGFLQGVTSGPAVVFAIVVAGLVHYNNGGVRG